MATIILLCCYLDFTWKKLKKHPTLFEFNDFLQFFFELKFIHWDFSLQFVISFCYFLSYMKWLILLGFVYKYIYNAQPRANQLRSQEEPHLRVQIPRLDRQQNQEFLPAASPKCPRCEIQCVNGYWELFDLFEERIRAIPRISGTHVHVFLPRAQKFRTMAYTELREAYQLEDYSNEILYALQGANTAWF